MKNTLLVLLLAILSVSFVFGAGTKEDAAASGTTTIRWAYWGSGQRVEISQKAIDLYQSRHPNIKVNPEVSGGAGDHFVKVDTQLAGGDGPDIIQVGGNIPDYADVLLDIFPFDGKAINLSVIDPSAIDSGTIAGRLVGISTGVNMPALVYNKSMVERIGAPLPKITMNYDEFKDYLRVLKSKLPAGVYPMQDIGVLSSNSTPFGYWTRYNGTPLYDASDKSTAVRPQDAQRYLELFDGYRKEGLIPPADIAAGYAENNADTSMVIAGKAVIGFIWTNQLSGYQAATTDELDFIEMPGAAETNALWQPPSQFYAVNKDSKNIEETVKFIDFLVNDPEAAFILGSDRGTPASSTARSAGSAFAADQKVINYMNIAGPHSSAETDHVPNDTEFNSTLYLIYQRVAFGQITPAQGGQQIYELLLRLIGK
ncbi:MAG: extracellular solute-binding protein [Spirochaetales bacterium]|nr:extracellular solute-binding protein [Spirochaetales bacterium]